MTRKIKGNIKGSTRVLSSLGQGGRREKEAMGPFIRPGQWESRSRERLWDLGMPHTHICSDSEMSEPRPVAPTSCTPPRTCHRDHPLPTVCRAASLPLWSDHQALQLPCAGELTPGSPHQTPLAAGFPECSLFPYMI